MILHQLNISSAHLSLSPPNNDLQLRTTNFYNGIEMFSRRVTHDGKGAQKRGWPADDVGGHSAGGPRGVIYSSRPIMSAKKHRRINRNTQDTIRLFGNNRQADSSRCLPSPSQSPPSESSFCPSLPEIGLPARDEGYSLRSLQPIPETRSSVRIERNTDDDSGPFEDDWSANAPPSSLTREEVRARIEKHEPMTDMILLTVLSR